MLRHQQINKRQRIFGIDPDQSVARVPGAILLTLIVTGFITFPESSDNQRARATYLAGVF